MKLDEVYEEYKYKSICFTLIKNNTNNNEYEIQVILMHTTNTTNS